jgi:signal transduction histidine kinase
VSFLANSLRRLGLPLLSVFLALQINWLIAPYLTILPLSLAFIAAIMVTAWYGGFRPALFAVVLSAFMINYYFLYPLNSLSADPAELAAIGVFLLEGVGIAYCIDYLRKNENQLRHANLELEERVASKRERLTENEERLRKLMLDLVVTEERERRSLANELHDYLAQLLTLARMKLKQAEQCVYSSTRDTSRYIGETDLMLNKSLGYVRTLMAELYPSQLQELGLPAALGWLAGEMPKHGLTVELSIEGESLSLQHEHAVLLYQSVRELLMNCVKHAAVDHARLSLTVHSDMLHIEVQDLGCGFDISTLPPSAAGTHFGLSSIRERMATVGGHFIVKSVVGQGTTITLKMPLESSFEPVALRAANASRQDCIKAKPTGPSDQESLPLL